MEDILLNIVKFFQTFEPAKFFESLRGLFWVLYIVLSFYLAIKTFKDADKRYSDKLVVFAITTLVFLSNLFGYLLYSLFKPKENISDMHMSKMEKYFLEYETRGIGKCKVCKFVYFPEHTYCVNCGSLVRTKCSMCSNIIELDWKVCPYCGDKKRTDIIHNVNHVAISTNLTSIESSTPTS